MPDRRYYRPIPRGLELTHRRGARAAASDARPDKAESRMIDPKLLRTDPEAVARNLARRGYRLDVAALQGTGGPAPPLADRDRPAARRAQRQRQGGGQARGRGEDIAPLLRAGEALTPSWRAPKAEHSSRRCRRARAAGSSSCRTCCTTSVPEGATSSANLEVPRWGEPRQLRFQAARSRRDRRAPRAAGFRGRGPHLGQRASW